MMATTKKYAEGIMVQYRDGCYSYGNTPIDDRIEDWSAVLTEADEIESLGELKGWSDWQEAFRVRVNDCDLYYFAR